MKPVPTDGNNRDRDATWSVVADVVWKFVLGFSFWWEMFGQFRARFGDRMDKGDSVLTGFEMGNDLVAERLPECRTAFLVDGNIAEDGESLRLGRDEDKNSVAALGLGHSQASKLTLGSGQSVNDLVMRDKYANLARRFAFGILDGLKQTLIVYLS